MLFWFVVKYLHIYDIKQINKKNYRSLASQISRLDKQIDELEHLEELEEEIESLKESFKGNSDVILIYFQNMIKILLKLIIENVKCISSKYDMYLYSFI